MSKLRAISLFSGAGGMDIGLEAAGFDILGHCEISPTARASLTLNRPNWTHLVESGDVVQLANALERQETGWRDVDLIAAGPPCQPFSRAAQWHLNGAQGLEDRRAESLSAFLNIVRIVQPKVVLIENVPEFAGNGPRSALSFLRGGFRAIERENGVSYVLDSRILNAADFGVPQNRRRAVVIATRTDREFHFPGETHKGCPMTAWDALWDAPPEDKPMMSGKWADLLPSVPEGMNYMHFTDRGDGPHLFGYRTRYWSFLLKLCRDRPSWTLPASPGPATGPFHWDSRPLSVREGMRIQSFPDSWQLVGDYREQWQQIGNATPPLLAEIVGRAVRLHCEGEDATTKPTLLRDRGPTVSPAPEVVSVPERYLRLRGEHPAHPGAGRGPGRLGALRS